MSINIPIVNAANLYADNLQIAWNSITTLTVTAGASRDSTNANDIILEAAVTIDTDNNGINGLDTGVLVANTLYGIYVVGDSTQTNGACCQISLSLTQPTVPGGYDMYRLIGYIRTDGSAELLAGFWSGSRNERFFAYDAPILVLAAGAAVVDTVVSLDTMVPAIAGLPVTFQYEIVSPSDSHYFTLKPYDAQGAYFYAITQVAGVPLGEHAIVPAQLNAGIPSVEYFWSAGGFDNANLWVAGYQYTI